MSQSIIAHVRVSYWTAYRAELRLVAFSPIHLIASAVFPATAFYVIYLSHYALSASNIFFVIFGLGFMPIILALNLFHRRRKNTLARGPVTYEFTEDELRTSTESFNSSVKWDAILRVVETKTFLFFFIAPARAFFLPLEALKTNDDLRLLRELVKRRVKTIKGPAW